MQNRSCDKWYWCPQDCTTAILVSSLTCYPDWSCKSNIVAVLKVGYRLWTSGNCLEHKPKSDLIILSSFYGTDAISSNLFVVCMPTICNSSNISNTYKQMQKRTSCLVPGKSEWYIKNTNYAMNVFNFFQRPVTLFILKNEIVLNAK